jgi:nitrogen fixation-related uncharacterized protein
VAPVAITNGEVILAVVFIAIPVALVAFALGARRSLESIGKGQFGLDRDFPEGGGGGPAPVSREAQEAEVRQMLEAKAYRQSARGEAPLDVDAEVERLLSERPTARLGADPELVEEVRQLVVARNERRARKGEEPLDVEAEVQRQLRDLENLGQ